MTVRGGSGRAVATGGLSGLTTQQMQDKAVFAGTGSLSALTTQNMQDGAVFVGTGSLSASPLGQLGTAALNGSGNLAALATLGLAASAVFAGTGSLSATATLGLVAAAEFDSAGSLSASASFGLAGLAQFNGTGSLSATALFGLAGLAQFNGTGSLTAVAFFYNSAEFDGAGSLTANATKSTGIAQQGSAEFDGAGGLSAIALLALAAFANLNGAGSLSALATLQEVDVATFNGAGGLSVTVSLALSAAATFNGTGSLTALATLHEAALAVFSGTGSLSALVTLHEAAAATFAGAGSLSALATLNEAAAATFAGAGGLSATTIQTDQVSAVFGGTGSLSASASTVTLLLASAVFNAGVGAFSQTFSGLLAHYPFDDTTWDDTSGNNNNLTPTGDPSLVPGQISNAVSLDGLPSYFSFANANAFSLASQTSPISISCWVKTTATDGMVLSLRNNSNGNPLIEFGVGRNNVAGGAGVFNVLFRDDSGSGLLSLPGVAVNDGNEHLVTWTRDSSQNQILYVDNVNVANGTDTAVTSTTFGSSGSGLGIEQYWTTNGGGPAGLPTGVPFVGTVDDLQIYNIALTSGQVTQIYNAGVGGGRASLTANATQIKVAYAEFDGAGSLAAAVTLALSAAATFSGSGSLSVGVSLALQVSARFNAGIGGPTSLTLSGLLAHYTFDTDANDSSGNGHNGTEFGSPTEVAGQINNALQFDGATNYVQLPNDPGFLNFPFSAAAITFWFRTTTNGVIFANTITGQTPGVTSPGGWVPAFYISPTDGKLYCSFIWHGATTDQLISGTALNDGNWHMVADTYSGGVETVYIDSNLLGSQTVSQTDYNAGAYNYFVGTGYWNAWPNAGSLWGFFGGAVDDMQFYSRGLSSGDVASIYNAGIQGGSGKASLTANAQRVTFALAEFDGAGSLSALATLALAAAATFNGAGSLTASALLGNAANAVFSGAGSLTANTRTGLAATAVFAGAGGLSATPSGAMLVSATFAGRGFFGIPPPPAKSAYGGSGRLLVTAKVYRGAAGPARNVVEIGPGIGQNKVAYA